MGLNPISWAGARSSAPAPAMPWEQVPSSRLWVLGSWGWLWGKAALALVSTCLGDQPGFLAWIFLHTEELCLDRVQLCSYGTWHRMTANSALCIAPCRHFLLEGWKAFKGLLFSLPCPQNHCARVFLIWCWAGGGEDENPPPKGRPQAHSARRPRSFIFPFNSLSQEMPCVSSLQGYGFRNGSCWSHELKEAVGSLTDLQLLWPRFYRCRVHELDAAVGAVLKQFSSFCGRLAMDLWLADSVNLAGDLSGKKRSISYLYDTQKRNSWC